MFAVPGVSLSLPLFPFIRGEVLPATFSLPHLLFFSTLLCLLSSSSSSLPPLLSSSHLSLHSPPISVLASLVSCLLHISLYTVPPSQSWPPSSPPDSSHLSLHSHLSLGLPRLLLSSSHLSLHSPPISVLASLVSSCLLHISLYTVPPSQSWPPSSPPAFFTSLFTQSPRLSLGLPRLLLPSSHLSLHSPPISVLASLVSSCLLHISLYTVPPSQSWPPSSPPAFLTSLFTQSSHLSLGLPRLLLPSSHLSLHSPPISVLASLVSSCLLHISLYTVPPSQSWPPSSPPAFLTSLFTQSSHLSLGLPRLLLSSSHLSLHSPPISVLASLVSSCRFSPLLIIMLVTFQSLSFACISLASSGLILRLLTLLHVLVLPT